MRRQGLLAFVLSFVLTLCCTSAAYADAGDDTAIPASEDAPASRVEDTPTLGMNVAANPEGEAVAPDAETAPIDISGALVDVASQTYTGRNLEPAPTVQMGDTTLARDADYSVSYADNREVGTGSIIVRGTGNYAGSASAPFEIGHATGVAAFTDLDASAWYLSENQGTLPGAKTLYLDSAVARGVMLGYEDSAGKRTKFGPEDPVTRAQTVAMLYRLSHPNATDTTDAEAIKGTANGSGLPDVPSAQYYTAAVNWAVEAGVVSGYRDAVERYYSFGADDPITREQLATMVGRFCVGFCGLPMVTAETKSFADSGKISSFATAGIQYCLANKIMSGYSGTQAFGPGDHATRSQMAKVMAMVISLTDADENIAANGWPTECTWRGGDSFPAPTPSNWVYEGGSWYYKNADGTNMTGFLEINGNKVHFADDGKMTTGWFKPGDGTTYHFADNGIAVKGWEFTGGRWHYFDEKTAAFVKKSLTRDPVLDSYIDNIIAMCHTLRGAYDYITGFTYIPGDDLIYSTRIDDATSIRFAREMVERHGGECYRFGALLSWVARGLGYESYAIAGWVDRYGGGKAPHGWTEVMQNGRTYVCDADMNNARPDRDWFMKPYESTPIVYHFW